MKPVPDLDSLELTDVSGGVRMSVKVIPRAPREELAGVRSGALLVRITAPPVEGKANLALVRCLARGFALPVSAVEVTGGLRGRHKTVFMAGITSEQVLERLSRAPG